jgi:cell division protein FtsZ
MQSDPGNSTGQTATFTFEENRILPVKIIVIGVGGAGGNAVNRMMDANVGGVELIAANTDVQALRESWAPVKLQIGAKITGGLGCGGDPELGRRAALEDTERILDLIQGADMVFIAGGVGGGTCTGAAPVIAGLAADAGALTVAVVTTPFGFLGRKRRACAEEGLRDLKSVVDTLITIPNERLLGTLGEDALLEESFRLADDILCQAVQGIADIITKPGIMNVDFADVRAVMGGKGMALMGTGMAEGRQRSVEATQRAISNPLLEEPTARGAKAVLVNISAGRSTFKLHEVKTAAGIIEELICPEDMFTGAVYDDSLGERMKITVIATGFAPLAWAGAANRDAPDRALDPLVALHASAESRRPAAPPPPSFKENLDEPAYRRRLAR